MIKLNVGDNVELFNHSKGSVKTIDKITYQFELDHENIITWFHIRNIKYLNGGLIDNELIIT